MRHQNTSYRIQALEVECMRKDRIYGLFQKNSKKERISYLKNTPFKALLHIKTVFTLYGVRVENLIQIYL
jgi:hypothetical protein